MNWADWEIGICHWLLSVYDGIPLVLGVGGGENGLFPMQFFVGDWTTNSVLYMGDGNLQNFVFRGNKPYSEGLKP